MELFFYVDRSRDKLEELHGYRTNQFVASVCSAKQNHDPSTTGRVAMSVSLSLSLFISLYSLSHVVCAAHMLLYGASGVIVSNERNPK